MSKRKTRHYKAARMSDGQVIVIDLSRNRVLWCSDCVHYTIRSLQMVDSGIDATPLLHELINENTRIIL